jgi:hypothetical protein
MLRPFRFTPAVLALALVVSGFTAMNPADAAPPSKGCSKVGHHISGAQYDIWFTAGKSDSAPDRLYKVDPSTGKATTITSETSVRPGYFVRGWLHMCTTVADHYGAIVRFRDSAENPNWNDRGPRQVVTPQLGRDINVGEFFQVVPDETQKPNGFFLQGKLEEEEVNVAVSPEFHVILADIAEPPPANCQPHSIDCPDNGDCSQGGFEADLLDGQLEDVALNPDGTRRNIPLKRGEMIAADGNINGNVFYCGGDGQVHAITIKFYPLYGTVTAAWEVAFYSDGPFTQQLTEGGGFYQQVPDEVGATFTFIPRVIGEPGATPDANVLAQGTPWDFTVCATFDGTLCK